jgi:hypothetical protein
MKRLIVRISQLLLLLCLLLLAVRHDAEPTSAAPARQSNLLNNPSLQWHSPELVQVASRTELQSKT